MGKICLTLVSVEEERYSKCVPFLHLVFGRGFLGAAKIFKFLLLNFPCDSRGFELPESLDTTEHLVALLTPHGTAIVCPWTAS